MAIWDLTTEKVKQHSENAGFYQGGAKTPFYVTQLQKLENQVMGPYSGEYQSWLKLMKQSCDFDPLQAKNGCQSFTFEFPSLLHPQVIFQNPG